MTDDVFTPVAAATGIGSLPLTDPDAAVRLGARLCPHMPFWPQLPRRDRREGMVSQMLGRLEAMFAAGTRNAYCLRFAGPSLDELLEAFRGGPAELVPASAAGFFAFQRAAQRGDLCRAAALKGQVTGPITMGLTLCRGPRERPLADHPLLLDALTQYLRRLAVWQVRRLARFRRPVVLFVCEPMLGLVDQFDAQTSRRHLAALASVVGAIRDTGATAGVHCCGPFDVDALQDAPPCVLSFDALQHLNGFAIGGGGRRWLERGGSLAFGLVPTQSAGPQISAEHLFGRWLMAASLMGDLRRVAQRTIITATCGLGLMDPVAAERCLATGAEVARVVRRIGACSGASVPGGGDPL